MFSFKIHYVLFYFASNPCGYMIRCKWNNTDVIMSTMASIITSLTIVYSTVYSKYRPKKTSKLRVTGLCEGDSPVTQRASKAKNVSIWWRHHEIDLSQTMIKREPWDVLLWEKNGCYIGNNFAMFVILESPMQKHRNIFFNINILQSTN